MSVVVWVSGPVFPFASRIPMTDPNYVFHPSQPQYRTPSARPIYSDSSDSEVDLWDAPVGTMLGGVAGTPSSSGRGNESSRGHSSGRSGGHGTTGTKQRGMARRNSREVTSPSTQSSPGSEDDTVNSVSDASTYHSSKDYSKRSIRVVERLVERAATSVKPPEEAYQDFRESLRRSAMKLKSVETAGNDGEGLANEDEDGTNQHRESFLAPLRERLVDRLGVGGTEVDVGTNEQLVTEPENTPKELTVTPVSVETKTAITAEDKTPLPGSSLPPRSPVHRDAKQEVVRVATVATAPPVATVGTVPPDPPAEAPVEEITSPRVRDMAKMFNQAVEVPSNSVSRTREDSRVSRISTSNTTPRVSLDGSDIFERAPSVSKTPPSRENSARRQTRRHSSESERANEGANERASEAYEDSRDNAASTRYMTKIQTQTLERRASMPQRNNGGRPFVNISNATSQTFAASDFSFGDTEREREVDDRSRSSNTDRSERHHHGRSSGRKSSRSHLVQKIESLEETVERLDRELSLATPGRGGVIDEIALLKASPLIEQLVTTALGHHLDTPVQSSEEVDNIPVSSEERDVSGGEPGISSGPPGTGTSKKTEDPFHELTVLAKRIYKTVAPIVGVILLFVVVIASAIAVSDVYDAVAMDAPVETTPVFGITSIYGGANQGSENPRGPYWQGHVGPAGRAMRAALHLPTTELTDWWHKNMRGERGGDDMPTPRPS